MVEEKEAPLKSSKLKLSNPIDSDVSIAKLIKMTRVIRTANAILVLRYDYLPRLNQQSATNSTRL